MPRAFILVLFLRLLAFSQSVNYQVTSAGFPTITSTTINTVADNSITGSYTYTVSDFASSSLTVSSSTISRGPGLRIAVSSTGAPNLASPLTSVPYVIFTVNVSVDGVPGQVTCYIGKRGATVSVLSRSFPTINGVTVSCPTIELAGVNMALPVTVDVPLVMSKGSFTITPMAVNLQVAQGSKATVHVGFSSTIAGVSILTNTYNSKVTTGQTSNPAEGYITYDATLEYPGTY